jgi:multiple antibiotic resistance protein
MIFEPVNLLAPAIWNDLLFFFIGSLVSLFSIVNPLLAAPVFVSLTQEDSVEEQRLTAKRASISVFWILVSFFVAGSLILSFFGISIDALRISGGLMILGSAYSMLEKKSRLQPEEEKEAEDKEDIAFSPIAMPLLSGPGAIAVIIGMTTDAKEWYYYPIIFLVISLVSFSCYWALRVSGKIVEKLGETMVKAFTRIMGFLLLCIGIQYIVNGVKPILIGIFKSAGV